MLVNLKDILADAQKNHYGVGLFNTPDTDMLDAAISAAEEARSPIVLGTGEELMPYGDLQLLAPAFVSAAKRAKVPVVVHLDHAFTYERCVEALSLGFSSIMFDGSSLPVEENISRTREIVKMAHAIGATVEGEIGHVGQASTCDNATDDLYTAPEDAVSFVEATDVDALAVAVGTAHGDYKVKPKLDLERLKLIRAATDTPLVLHGGSGLADQDFRDAIRCGIAKVNIFTDMCTAAQNAMKENADKHYMQIRDARYQAVREVVLRKIMLFGSNGKY